MCVTGQPALVQHSSQPARDVTATDVTASHDVTASDGGDVTVDEEDFYAALSRLTPSLSTAELRRYDALQEMFTQRRPGNQHAPAAAAADVAQH